MGCAGSKLDDLPAVTLCRERCNHLDEAIKQRYAFSEAHVDYLNALKSVGVSLDRFFTQDPDGPVLGVSSPVLNLPKVRKGDPDPVHESASDSEKVHHHLHSGSHSDSGSHLHFHSDDEDSDDGSGSGTESENPHGNGNHLHFDDEEFNEPVYNQPVQYGPGFFPGYEGLNLNGNSNGGYMNVNYMKKGVTQSVVYTQRPMSVETMHIGESSNSASASTSYNNSYSNNNSYSGYDYSSNYNGYANHGGGGGGFFGGGGGPVVQNEAFSRREDPPPPPPPPPPASGSDWGFLNPFESFEKYYPTYPSSRDLREVREEEGIPDLEDEDDEVIVKEVHGDNHKYNVDSGRSSFSKPRMSGEGGGNLHYKAEKDPPEFEVHLVDKKVVDTGERSKDQENGKARGGGFKGDAEVLREIQVQFDRASESEAGLAKVLEVGKIPYKQKHGHVSSKLLHLPVLSSTPRSADNSDQVSVDGEHEMELRSKNLSSTLHKLYLWEKKLYEEVKAEERMRINHEQKARKLKHLDERGAESTKIDSTRAVVRDLSTRIRMAIQVVDRISVKINSLRDDELWPQLNEFIQGLSRMWKSMLECHQSQCQAIAEAKWLDAIAIRNQFSESRVEATCQLERDLINWTLRFSYWVGAQKGYVRALNDWLMKCLYYEPEETPDGIVPFSPGRIGAPPVFVVCNQWWQSLERISEKEVVDSMRDLASNVLQLWDRDKAELRQRMLASKDERRIRSLEKEDQRIHKEIQALDKRVVLNEKGMSLTGHVYQSETHKSGSLQASLLHVFEALERFTNNSLKVYEDLLRRIDEDHLGKEHDDRGS